MFILEKEPKNLDDALNMASHLEEFDFMGQPDRKRIRANRDLHVPRPAARNPPVQRERRCRKRS